MKKQSAKNTIIKIARKQDNYTIQDTHCARNEKLSWKARGIHHYVMQLPEDWELNMADLQNRAPDGRDSLASGVAELVKAGYWYIEQLRDKGRMSGNRYWVFERPDQNHFLTATATGKSVSGESESGLPDPGKSATTNNENSLFNNNEVDEGLREAPPAFIMPSDEELIGAGDRHLRNKAKASYSNLKGPKYWLEYELEDFKAHWEELGWKHPKGKRKDQYVDPKRAFATWMGFWLNSSSARFYCITDPRHPNNQQDGGQSGEGESYVYERDINESFGDKGSSAGQLLAERLKKN